MVTKIHTTKKLEKLAKKLISYDQDEPDGKLGKWNATYFLLDRKKCWLITNGPTKYNLILPNIKAPDLKNIDSIFILALSEQLAYDGIVLDPASLSSMIGALRFLPTDNDRSTTGFQNQRLFEIDCWKQRFNTFETMPIKVINNRLNSVPIQLGKQKNRHDYTDSISEMKNLLVQL
ncbi:DUF6933 domain-containing protein [Flavilitoribacter nigricans]|uniref:DUF6933 domain-containing protein n=1 Tax=Flavilitoribacter nigricans (strain ATCC 23147 / DSM 23189 / NBRC 102662 / NCIMB 1420 / SS-2) TaxID=1122177 RepID=A0A2D0NGW3_FLAN2|nr:hypothetical protein [Flavilitoribacter nigricans]PHN07003.1 hypothetical protein CRP01_08570 [Flavilitoribacter nigricans DSM 23189 = NBRC 102662]